VQVRVSSWLDPFSNYDQNYQVINAQFGIAFGGAFGTGWGLGRPNLTPLAKTDFIAAAMGEELGVAGLLAIMLLYGLIVARGLRAALVARDPFGKLLAAGLAFVFAIQVFAILGGVTRLLPLTGLTTPFMSQGGSSLIANWVTVGLLLIVTHQVRRPVADQAVEPQQWLEAETTQMIPVGASSTPAGMAGPSNSPRPGAPSGPQATTEPITPISPDEEGDDPTEIVQLPGGRP
jgi:hypothetical protein